MDNHILFCSKAKKMTALFFLCLFLGINMAHGKSRLLQKYALRNAFQKSSARHVITVHINNLKLADALRKVAHEAHIGVSFNANILPDHKVLLDVQNVSIYTAMKLLLRGFGLEAVPSQNRHVLIIQKKPSPKLSKLDVIQQETVSGTVTDAQTGDPLLGVNILVVGTSTGTATDASGHYSVTVPSLQDSLRFSYIGYQTQTVAINGRATVDIALKSAIAGLNQLVVIGFGEKTKRNLVGSVASVSTSSLQDASTSTVETSLIGRVAGVQLTGVGGAVGAPTSVHIRGTSSINASSQPLYVIDGTPLIGAQFGVSTYGGSGGGTNPLLNISPDNIKSIQVLKDAVATAIYGTRGANGVILITTKHGFNQSPQLAIKISGGFSHPINQYHTLNTKQYLKIYNYKHSTNLDPRNYANTDWLKAITQTGSNQQYFLSYSGGSKDNTYYLSGFYNKEQGYVINNGNTKFGLRINTTHTFKNKLKINLSFSPSYSDFKQLNTRNYAGNPYSDALLEPPMAPIYTKDGKINNGKYTDVPGNSFVSFSGTPYADAIGQNIHNRIIQILGHLSVSYDILNNLTIKTKLGTQAIRSGVNIHNKDFTRAGYPTGTASVRNIAFTTYTWQNTLNYKKDWNEQSIEATLGATFVNTTKRVGGGLGANIPVNKLKVINTSSAVRRLFGTNSTYRFQNNLARITYSYKDTYLITATGSYNGTSRFAQDSRYGFFPSVGVGWIMSNEGFLEGFNALNFLKLRVTYGVTGNANIGNFAYAGLISSGGNYNGQPGFAISQIGNTGLGWEESKQYDISLDFRFLNSRLKGTISYYHKTDSDLLLSAPVSNINGFTSITKNLGSMLNKGIEFSINANILTQKVLWNVYANISHNHNEVTKLPGGTIIAGNSIVKVGESIGSFYLPIYKGINHQDGSALFSDGHGGTTHNYGAAPRQIVGNPHPKYFGGFGTSISYKGFKADANFQYSRGAKLYWTLGHYLECSGCVPYNQLQGQQNFWTPQNKDSNIPEPRLGPNGNNPSTRYLSDASFLRLKSLTLGYTFSFLSGNTIRFYVRGLNLFTITNYIGADPTSVISQGNISQGYNYFNMPLSRKWIFGIKITL